LVQLGEGVVVLAKAELALSKLAGQPVVAVDVDLDCEREPGLQAEMNQTAIGIEEIIVQYAMRPARENQARSSLAMNQLDGAASFHDLQDGDQSFAETALADGVLDELLFAAGA